MCALVKPPFLDATERELAASASSKPDTARIAALGTAERILERFVGKHVMVEPVASEICPCMASHGVELPAWNYGQPDSACRFQGFNITIGDTHH